MKRAVDILVAHHESFVHSCNELEPIKLGLHDWVISSTYSLADSDALIINLDCPLHSGVWASVSHWSGMHAVLWTYWWRLDHRWKSYRGSISFAPMCVRFRALVTLSTAVWLALVDGALLSKELLIKIKAHQSRLRDAKLLSHLLLFVSRHVVYCLVNYRWHPFERGPENVIITVINLATFLALRFLGARRNLAYMI